MKQKLCRRLEELERFSAAAAARRASTERDSTAVLEQIIAETQAWHAVPENQAWLAAQPPDYLRNSMRALREELIALSSGHHRRGAASRSSEL